MADTKKSTFARGVLVSTLGNFAPVLAGLITAPLLAQHLGVSGRGELAAAVAPMLLVISAVTFGVPEAITYHVARKIGRPGLILKRSSIILLVTGILSSVAVVLLSGELSNHQAELAGLISLAAIAITPGLLVGAIRGYAAGREMWTLIAAERTVSALMRLIAIAVLALLGAITPVSATVAFAGTSIAGGIVYFALLRRRARSSAAVDSPEVPRIFRYGVGLWMGTLAGVLLSRLDQILMVPLSGTYMLGIYVVAVTISEVVLVFNKSVRDVVFAAESADNQSARLSQASRISTMVTTVGALVVAACCFPVIPWLFGEEFAPAVPVTIVLLIAIVLGNPGSVAGAGLSARGRPVLRSVSLAIAAAINVGLLFLLVPTWGAMGAAFATLFGNIIAGYTNIIWMRVFFKVPILDFVGLRRRDLTDSVSMFKRVLGGRVRSKNSA